MVLSAAAEVRVVLTTPGAKRDLHNQIKSAMDTVMIARDKRAGPDDILAAAQADYRNIVTALYNEGYFGPTVSILVDGREAAGIPAFARLGRIETVEARVETGPKFTFGTAAIGPLPKDARRPFRYTTGETATLGRLQGAAERGIEAWRKVGHAKARVASQDIIADHGAARLDATIRLDPGPKLVFGQLHTEGLTRLRDDRAREIAGLPSGATFDPAELERAANRLRRTGVFRSVALSEAEEIGPGQSLDITAELVEQKPRRFGFGFEISSLDGGSVSTYWLHRNLLGGAERLRVDAEVSGISRANDGIDYELGVTYTRPATFGADTDLGLALTHAFHDEPGYSAATTEAQVSLTRRVTDTLTVSAGVLLLHERSRDGFGTRRFTLAGVPVEATLDQRDDRLNPTSGYYLSAAAMPYAGLASTPSGLRFSGDARAYRALDDAGKYVLAGRLQLGSLVGPAIAEAPPDYLFYSGGGGTVRGQKYQSLGISQGGTFSGGRSFLGLSGEFRARAGRKLTVVGFYDIGLIGADPVPGGDNWHAGTGVGIRFDTGLGPIRLDLATPASGDAAFGRLEIYVGIGQAF